MKDFVTAVVKEAVSYIASVGLWAIICLCFGWTFTWRIATGIYLVTEYVALTIERCRFE